MLESTGSSAELLPWLFLANNKIVVNKDGGLMACIKIKTACSDTLTMEKRNIIATSHQKAIDTFRDTNISIWWNFHKHLDNDYPEHKFPDEISAFIDDNRKNFFALNPHYKIDHYCSIILHPNIGINKFLHLFQFFYKKKELSLATSLTKSIFCYFGENSLFPYLEQEMYDEIAHFECLIDKFISCLHDFQIQRLTNDNGSLGEFLYSSANPCHHKRTVAIPTENWMIDSFITDNKISVNDNHLLFAGKNNSAKYASAITVKIATKNGGLKFTSPETGINNILSIPTEMNLSFCFRILSTKQSSQHIRNMKRWYSYQMYSWKTYLSAALLQSSLGESSSIRSKKQLFDQCDDLQYQIDSSNTTMGHCNTTIMIYENDIQSLSKKKKLLFDWLNKTNFIFIEETDHCLSSWMATNPGMSHGCCRWSILSSANVADNLPITYYQDEYCQPSPYLSKITNKHPISFLSGEHQQKIPFQPYVGNNGHCFIVGPTGSGKSLFANFQMSQFRKYQGTKIFVLDYDNSSKVPILLQGGIYIDLSDSNNEKINLNPFSLLHDRTSWPWIRDWIFHLIGDSDNSLKNNYAHEVELIIESMSCLDKINWHIKTLYLHITSDPLKIRLQEWINKEFYGKWIGTGVDIFDLSMGKNPIIGFEMKSLIHSSPNLYPIIEYIFYRIERHLSQKTPLDHVTPSIVYIAECWNFLSHPLLMNRISTWLKTFRKYLCSVWMDTQSIEDLFLSGIFPSIRDNIASRVFFPNHKASSNSLKTIYMKEFGLNEEEVAYINDSQPQKDLLVIQGKSSYRASLVIDKDLAAILSSEIKRIQHLELCRETNKDNWKDLYLCHHDT
ncbi:MULTISPECIES: VirB4 family type IV secretion system protein [Candidatus Ichthyocystis]|uniref:Putative Type II/IV secretion system chaperone protein n=1 Tax=Candidatus Ichthyocystis hellenicum TaxID=1561003 RepID=A0A0S4M336_9BURK|nr:MULTISPECIES: VirB4 family type IV secretion system protein [Ichthyocystis]CUT17423.1 putative Type II/IV secretion system chaperone protein [Candidatus Ichthyocystis hellenicum]